MSTTPPRIVMTPPTQRRILLALLAASVLALPVGVVAEAAFKVKMAVCNGPWASAAIHGAPGAYTIAAVDTDSNAAGRIEWHDSQLRRGGPIFYSTWLDKRRLEVTFFNGDSPTREVEEGLRTRFAEYVRTIEGQPNVAQRIMEGNVARYGPLWLGMWGNGAVITIPALLLFVGVLGVRHGQGHSECDSCGYSTAGLTTAICPECGTPFDAAHLMVEVPQNSAAPPS